MSCGPNLSVLSSTSSLLTSGQPSCKKKYPPSLHISHSLAMRCLSLQIKSGEGDQSSQWKNSQMEMNPHCPWITRILRTLAKWLSPILFKFGQLSLCYPSITSMSKVLECLICLLVSTSCELAKSADGDLWVWLHSYVVTHLRLFPWMAEGCRLNLVSTRSYKTSQASC